MQGDAQQWDAGVVGGDEPLRSGGGMGEGEIYLGNGSGRGQEGGVPGWSEPESGGAYQGGPLFSTIDSQAPSSEQPVEWHTARCCRLVLSWARNVRVHHQHGVLCTQRL